MDIKYISPQEAESIKRKMPKSKVMVEFEGYLKQLPDGQVGKIETTTKDGLKPQTVRGRLIRAGKNLNIDLETRRVGNVVLFWRL
jgi:hypothetical protein